MAVLYSGLGLILVVLSVCAWRTLRIRPEKHAVASTIAPKWLAVDEKQMAERLSRAIRFQTISHQDANATDWRCFEAFADFLRETYPLTHQTLERETIAEHALLYRWKSGASRQDADTRPILLMAHQDVVQQGDEASWHHAPFSGDIADGCVWGRGALDMKSHLLAIFEAAEALLAQGFSPGRDIYIALGKDEELSGRTSAGELADLLRQRGIHFAFVLDEGTNCFYDGALFGADCTMAAIGVCEKGYGVVTLEARDDGGHGSLPPRHTALAKVAKAAARIDAHTFPARIATPTSGMIDALLPYMPMRNRWVYANRWLFAPWIVRRLSQNRQTNAWLRTTAALTMADGAPQVNVLPQRAEMRFNLRAAPWNKLNRIAHDMQRWARDKDVRVRVNAGAASPVSSLEGVGYRIVSQTVKECFEGCVPVPALMLGGTDSIHFVYDCDSVFRFSPYSCYQRLGHTIHAADERIEIACLGEGVRFFARLIQNSCDRATS